jgi:hypothetical protein
MDQILNHILTNNEKLITYGELNEKVLMELKMTTSLYEHIEIVTDYYDDDERPYDNNWTDVEGMGYGWAWLSYEERDWHMMMSKLVSDEADVLKHADNVLYFKYEKEDAITFHFIRLDGMYRTDVLIRFSNKELDF